MLKKLVTAAMCLSLSPAIAGEPSPDSIYVVGGSANVVLPGCRADVDLIEKNAYVQGGGSAYSAGQCDGMIAAIFAVGPSLGRARFCLPDHVTTGQALRMIIRYFENAPEKMNENFIARAIAVLHDPPTPPRPEQLSPDTPWYGDDSNT
jgi:hypothetical protein